MGADHQVRSHLRAELCEQARIGPRFAGRGNAVGDHADAERLVCRLEATAQRIARTDGAQRNQLYREMSRQMEADTVWLVTDSRFRNMLLQPYVVGYKKSPVNSNEWMYMDLEPRR